MGNNATKRTEGAIRSQAIGNGTSTKRLIADEISVAVDPQVTINQLWNLALLTANRSGADVVGTVKHENYPQGFSGVILLLDGHIALQYGIETINLGFDSIGELNIIICTNGGPGLQEQLRADYIEQFTDLLP